MEIPSTRSISFHSIDTLTNVKESVVTKVQKSQMMEIPFTIQFDDIKSLFLQVRLPWFSWSFDIYDSIGEVQAI